MWKSQKKKKILRRFIKCPIALFWDFGICTSLLLALHCGNQIRKKRTSLKTLVSKKATIWWLKISQNNDKFLSEMSSSYHME